MTIRRMDHAGIVVNDLAAACSISRRSSAVSSTAAAPRLSSQAMRIGGAEDGHDPRLPGERPCEGDLRPRRLLPLRHLLDNSTKARFA
jgi:hypothetical protein